MKGFDQCSGNISSLSESHLEVALISFVLGLFVVVIFACEGWYVMGGVWKRPSNPCLSSPRVFCASLLRVEFQQILICRCRSIAWCVVSADHASKDSCEEVSAPSKDLTVYPRYSVDYLSDPIQHSPMIAQHSKTTISPAFTNC
jgi:hypothetical protein